MRVKEPRLARAYGEAHVLGTPGSAKDARIHRTRINVNDHGLSSQLHCTKSGEHISQIRAHRKINKE